MQNVGLIRSNFVKKLKKLALSIGFSHILHGEYLLKQKVVVVQTPEWKFKANAGFDLMTRDLYFMVLVEVFTNHYTAEDTYFMNHIARMDRTQHLNRYQIIWQSFLSTISIIHFFVK